MSGVAPVLSAREKSLRMYREGERAGADAWCDVDRRVRREGEQTLRRSSDVLLLCVCVGTWGPLRAWSGTLARSAGDGVASLSHVRGISMIYAWTPVYDGDGRRRSPFSLLNTSCSGIAVEGAEVIGGKAVERSAIQGETTGAGRMRRYP